MDQKFGMVLFPAYRLQDAIQRATLGSRTWVNLASKLNLDRKRYLERNQVKRKLTRWEQFVRGWQACFGLEPDTGYRPLTAEEALQVHDAGKGTGPHRAFRPVSGWLNLCLPATMFWTVLHRRQTQPFPRPLPSSLLPQVVTFQRSSFWRPRSRDRREVCPSFA